MSTIEVDDELKLLIESKLNSGHYSNVGDLLKAALTQLPTEDFDDEVEMRESLEALREGMEDARAGRHRSVDEVFGEME